MWLALGLMLVLASALRLWKIHDVTGNVFYDAAVRSMGTSWHDFFFGALEPSGTVSIDKPPVDLWLQVASTRVLGFSLVGLHLPEALGGVAACWLLFGALRRPFGFAAALLAALALAVLPVSVLTARSDTMDSVLAALEIAALWCSWQALQSGRMRWSVLAAAVMGLAFNVKLSEMLIALPALALLWLWAAAPGTRVRVALATAGTFLAVALSWTAIASLTPTSMRPFPIGSANGSIWHVTLVYDGLARLSSHGGTGTAEGGAGPLRLLSAGPTQYWTLIGVALLATLLLGLLTDFSTPALSRYLRGHRDGTHYEVAAANINDVIGLVARDDLPVLVLNSVDGSLTHTRSLRAQVAGRRVRFYFVAPHPCHSGRHCPYNQIWAYAHSTPVPGQPGLRRFAAS